MKASATWLVKLQGTGNLFTLEPGCIMGILNITPDSFYEKSRVTASEIISKAATILAEGCKILDVGAQSTRPDFKSITPDEEWKILAEPLTLLRKEFPATPISVDTFHAEVAFKAAEAGCDIINDVSGGLLSPDIYRVCAENSLVYIAGHAFSADLHHKNPEATVVSMCNDLSVITHKCNILGVADVWVDPGLGFGKEQKMNFEILRNLQQYHIFNKPVVVGLSRKSFIWKTLESSAAEALNGTTALHAVALLNGATILRVHDVKEAAETVKLISNVLGN